ncbi:MAG: hypothetical protein H6835_19545 [Planctomycetes bacterium]|nr:hypothetical protein [Planctomycetota bacterium]
MNRSLLPLLPILSFAASPLSAQKVWVDRNATAAGLCGQQIVYDAARGETLLIGTQVCNEVRAWDGATWTSKAPTMLPPSRPFRAAYDSIRQVVVAVVGDPSHALETWEWNGSDWSMRASGGVPARNSWSLVFDAARGEMLLFGGETQGSTYADMWGWDGTQWTLRFFGGPTPRYGAAMVYDPQQQTVLLFGGTGSGLGGVATDFGDTWEWDGSQWSKYFALPGPSPRRLASMAYDTVRQRAVLYGGFDGAPLTDTWEWDGADWTQVLVPGMGAAQSIAYDVTRDVIVGWTNNARTFEYLPGVVAAFDTYGSGCAGPAGTPDLHAVGGSVPRIGTTLQLEVSALPASLFNVPVGFIGFDDTQWGGLPLPLPLDVLGFPGCSAFLAPELSVGLSNNAGVASWNVAIPLDVAAVGVDLYFQAGVLVLGWNPGAFVFSNAGHALVGNY